MPLFLVDFGAWLSQPSADFAREISAESAENKGFRARSDYSLLPRCLLRSVYWGFFIRRIELAMPICYNITDFYTVIDLFRVLRKGFIHVVL